MDGKFQLSQAQDLLNRGNKKTSHSKEISHYFSLIVSNYKAECVIIATIHFGTKTTIGQINLERTKWLLFVRGFSTLPSIQKNLGQGQLSLKTRTLKSFYKPTNWKIQVWLEILVLRTNDFSGFQLFKNLGFSIINENSSPKFSHQFSILMDFQQLFDLHFGDTTLALVPELSRGVEVQTVLPISF